MLIGFFKTVLFFTVFRNIEGSVMQLNCKTFVFVKFFFPLPQSRSGLKCLFSAVFYKFENSEIFSPKGAL